MGTHPGLVEAEAGGHLLLVYKWPTARARTRTPRGSSSLAERVAGEAVVARVPLLILVQRNCSAVFLCC